MMCLKEVFPFPTHLLIEIFIHQVFDHYQLFSHTARDVNKSIVPRREEEGKCFMNEESLQWCSCLKE